MRVLVTGATGFIGSAVVQELLRHGHHVLGGARSPGAAAAVERAGAVPCHVDIEDVASLKSAASACDAVVHTAFNHDFSSFQAHCEADRRAIEALAEALKGSRRPLIVSSALGILPQGVIASEESMPATGPSGHPRAASERAAVRAAQEGVPVSIVRLAPSVHGQGDHGFVPFLIGHARKTGVSAFVGDGRNRWAAVHRLDAAGLYRLALERGAPFACYHAAAEQGVEFRVIAGAIADGLGLPSGSLDAEACVRHFGWFAHFAAMDIPASSERTREILGWAPTQPGLLQDLHEASYFEP